MFSKALILAVILIVGEMNVDARTITRSGVTGNVNLVEVEARGTIYGKCSYVRDGQEISVMYEETGLEMKASAANPTILDPTAEVRECREAATKTLASEPKYRSGLGKPKADESPEELAMRFMDIEEKIASNQDYIDGLRPRIPFPFLGAAIKKKFLLSMLMGSHGFQGQGLALSLPQMQPHNPAFTVQMPEHSFSKIGFFMPFMKNFGWR